jgi:hypothetical protein
MHNRNPNCSFCFSAFVMGNAEVKCAGSSGCLFSNRDVRLQYPRTSCTVNISCYRFKVIYTLQVSSTYKFHFQQIHKATFTLHNLRLHITAIITETHCCKDISSPCRGAIFCLYLCNNVTP